ncbi:hypothetical protein EDB84DRAFT_1581744 [Lactarius hengduanensis]|nr:hypothetical protein EDB84DRAFT_1581744 [Lactarius hengduanensis]
MSFPSQTSAPSSIFKSMLDAALYEYKKMTGNDLLAYRLADELRTCDDQKLMKWIDPLVGVLYTFSRVLGDGVSLAFPPVRVIFTGIGVLLAAAKDVRASHGAIIDLFERVENCFKRLGVYTDISLTTAMAEVLVKIVIELLSILSIATKEVKRRRAKNYLGRVKEAGLPNTGGGPNGDSSNSEDHNCVSDLFSI